MLCSYDVAYGPCDWPSRCVQSRNAIQPTAAANKSAECVRLQQLFGQLSVEMHVCVCKSVCVRV